MFHVLQRDLRHLINGKTEWNRVKSMNIKILNMVRYKTLIIITEKKRTHYDNITSKSKNIKLLNIMRHRTLIIIITKNTTKTERTLR